MGRALILEISPRIVVVEVEAYPEAFVGVYGKFGIDVVFAVLLVAAVVVAQISEW